MAIPITIPMARDVKLNHDLLVHETCFSIINLTNETLLKNLWLAST